ncbi:MAG: DUF3347 domain-containing protein [Bacteroidota bacterium]|nr:DUF3347 domain-containing protein [Bacteroidota bacterium]
MKKIILLAALIAAPFTQQVFARDTNQPPLSSLLHSYYDIKNALINSNSKDAAAHAGDFLKVIDGVDTKSLAAADMKSFMFFREKLAFDAKHISESGDITHQREHFANFSANFFKLAKAVKLTDQVVYYDYCPMKKSYWLSADASIKNPYYGQQMLTCGKVTETINK